MIGPHLLHSVKCHPEVDKIFTLNSPDLQISLKKKSRCKIQVNEEGAILVLELEGTEVIVRPALFLPNGYPKIHNCLLERIPLYHPSILTIGESLLKVNIFYSIFLDELNLDKYLISNRVAFFCRQISRRYGRFNFGLQSPILFSPSIRTA